MLEYGLGGQERKLEVNESISEIPLNRTLLVEQLTAEAPVKPELVYGLKTIEEVFEHYKPATEVEYEKEDGSVTVETLQFRSLGDFGKRGIIAQSDHLQELNIQADDFQKIVRNLKSNKILKTVLDNTETKSAYIAAIKVLLAELEQVD